MQPVGVDGLVPTAVPSFAAARVRDGSHPDGTLAFSNDVPDNDHDRSMDARNREDQAMQRDSAVERVPAPGRTPALMVELHSFAAGARP